MKESIYRVKQKFSIVFLVVCFIRTAQCTPCSRNESVNITAGVVFENASIIFNGIEYVESSWYEVEQDGAVVRFGCPCIGRNCVWKCCDTGSMFFNRSCNTTEDESVNPFSPSLFEGEQPINISAPTIFFYMHGNLCDLRYLVDADQGFLQKNGTLLELMNGEPYYWHLPGSFCMDMMTTDESSPPELVSLVCLNEEGEEDFPALWISYAVGLILSVPFLLATFLVYAIIPELRNLHGKCLMAYCFGLIVAFPLLAYLKLHVGEIGFGRSGCIVMALIIYYAFQTSFFWLNIMCIDIWRTFSVYQGGTSNKRRDKRRFFYYGLYAWGIPLVLTAFTAGMQFSEDLPSHIIRPNIARRACWFADRMSELLYFYIPVLVLVVCNVVLFAITAHKIRSIRQETAILKSSESSRSDKLKRDKQRYGLYLKLFIVMGVNWSVEVISFAIGGSNWYWIIVDLSNLSLGVFIFFIFVWKNKVRDLVRKKFSKWRGKDRGSLSAADASASRWATRSSTAPTETTRVSSDDHTNNYDMTLTRPLADGKTTIT